MRHYGIITLIVLCLAFISCQTLRISVPAGKHQSNPPSGEFWAGASQIDITPPPGHSMGGYGNELSKISRGWWARLYAKANYVEDKEGDYVIFVSTDLWGMPGGLIDKVVEYVHAYQGPQYKIPREKLMISAIHTHNGPGNYLTAAGYNLGTSALIGFDEKLFELLAQRIAHCIKGAIDGRQKADLFLNHVAAVGYSRNRSVGAFQLNPLELRKEVIDAVDPAQIIDDPSINCYVRSDSTFRAVDPTLTTLTMVSKSNGKPIGILTFFGAHPTVMGFRNELVSSDIFGVASRYVQEYLTQANELEIQKAPVISFFNTTEGDISANWFDQDLENTFRIGKGLAKKIMESHTNANNKQEKIKGNVIASLEFPNIRDVEVDDPYNEIDCGQPHPPRTAKMPMVGKASLNGAEDGRTNGICRIDECYFDEGQTVPCTGPQGVKDELKISVLAARSFPKNVPIGLYKIGKLFIATIPGETTTMLGHRIKKAADSQDTAHTVVISLANEYISYLSTPSEYKAQNYEGAFTVYGTATGLFLVDRIKRLARIGASPSRYSGRKKYRAGFVLNKEEVRNKFTRDLWYPEIRLPLVYDKRNVDAQDFFQTFEWDHPFDVVNSYAEKSVGPLIPVITVQEEVNGNWQDLSIPNDVLGTNHAYNELQSDQSSLRFLTYIKSTADGRQKWETRYTPPKGFNTNNNIRIQVKHADSNTFTSDAFKLTTN